MTSDRVVIIGGGPVGLSAAWFLASQGAEVVVVDRNQDPGLDTGTGSAGLLTPSHCVPLAGMRVLRNLPAWLMRRGMISVKPRLDLELARFGALSARAGRGGLGLAGLRALRDQARAGLEIYAELAAEHPKVGFRQAGVMNVCATAAGLEALMEEADLLEREGIRPRRLDGGEAVALEPALRDGIAGAVLWEEDASIVPRNAVGALAEAARAAGAEIRMGATVKGFERGRDGHLSSVLLEDRAEPARTVVLAAGVETSRLARGLVGRIPLQAGKGHHLHLPRWRSRPSIPVIFNEHAMTASAMGEGLRLTGGMDFVGVDRTIDRRRIADILDLAGGYLREPPNAEAAARPGVARWSGLRPCSPDGLPIVGFTRAVPNLLVAAGHGMLGLTLGPAAGRDIADLILGVRRPRSEADWQEQFSPARFGI